MVSVGSTMLSRSSIHQRKTHRAKKRKSWAYRSSGFVRWTAVPDVCKYCLEVSFR